jgi:hypothetical protein
MRQAQGYSIITGPAPGTGELDSYTCAHCNSVRFVPPMCPAADMPDVCHLCGDKSRPSFICEGCRGKGCDPFEEKLKRMEARSHYVAEWV